MKRVWHEKAWEEYLSLNTIESICCTLDCGVDDVLEFVPDNMEEK